MTRIDIVAAVRSEEESLPDFVRGVRSLPLSDEVELGLLFIEDSSDDDTLPTLRALSASDPSLRYYALAEGLFGLDDTSVAIPVIQRCIGLQVYCGGCHD